MTRRNRIILVATAILCGALALAAVRAHDAPRVATGFISHTLCSAAFVSDVDPDRVFAETVDAMPGVNLIAWAIGYRIDRQAKQVDGDAVRRREKPRGLSRRALVAYSRMAMRRSMPRGRRGTARRNPPCCRRSRDPRWSKPQNPQLAAAFDRAFAEPEKPPFRHTNAIVVVKDGHIVAERYAPGYGIDTPILGYSATKSVTSALIGILVRQGRLALDQPAPVAAWQNPGDPRHAITIEQLLRHTSGLAMGSSLNASLASAFAPVNRMKFIERDMARICRKRRSRDVPGSTWNYHDGNFLILSRLIRDAAGGHAADVLRFAREQLFGPLGMRHVTLEFDASGTPEGIEPDAGVGTRLGALRHALSQ